MKLPLNCHFVDQTSSTQDYAFELALNNLLPVWGSVLAERQTAGRGQLRRSWSSLPGNLFLSLRLPETPLFYSHPASVAVGVLFALGLRKDGYPVFLKWPNDLVCEISGTDLQTPPHLAKIGGILLEEKQKIIIAGIGINLRFYPDISTFEEKPKLPVGALINTGIKPPQAAELWSTLAERLKILYEKYFQSTQWVEKANELLVWKNQEVACMDCDATFKGVLLGVNSQGEAIIQTGKGIKKVVSGTIIKD